MVPSPLHSKRWMEGSPMQFEQHLLRVIGLKHRTSPIILVLPLGMGVKVLLVGGGPDILSYPLGYAPPSANCHMLVNSWCSLVTFIMHLKRKAQVPPEGEKTWRAWGQGDLRVPCPGASCPAYSHFCPVTIALLAEDGHLVRLEEGMVQAPSMACSLLQEQGTYVLVQIISK